MKEKKVTRVPQKENDKSCDLVRIVNGIEEGKE